MRRGRFLISARPENARYYNIYLYVCYSAIVCVFREGLYNICIRSYVDGLVGKTRERCSKLKSTHFSEASNKTTTLEYNNMVRIIYIYSSERDTLEFSRFSVDPAQEIKLPLRVFDIYK